MTKALLDYLNPSDAELEYLLEGLPYTKAYLEDSSNWITSSEREVLCQRAIDLVHNDSLMYNVGLYTPNLKSLGGIKTIVRLLGTPRIAFQNIPKYSGWFDREFKFNVEIKSERQAVITMTKPGSQPVSRNACYYTQGILAAIPTVWRLPPAVVNETKCMCGDDTENSSEVCEYEVTWEPGRSRWWGFVNKVFRFFYKKTIAGIEEDLEIADRKNSELTLRNLQISKIREMALAVSQLKVNEEVFSTIVELIRDMPNVKFVYMLTWGDTRNEIRLPYYSKIRNPAIKIALRNVGFSFDEFLGEKPDSNTFSIDAGKSVLFKEFLADPRISTYDSIARVLEGVLPRPLCDSIQKVTGIKEIGIIPIAIGGELKAGMVIFLTETIQFDILEMIWSHCLSAIQNIENIRALEETNSELVSANKVLQQAETALKESEQRYRLLAENMSDSVWVMNRNLKVEWISPSAEKLRGYSVEEIMSMPLHKHLTPASLRKALRVFAAELAKYIKNPHREVYVELDLEFYCKDGSTLWLECYFSILRDDEKKPIGILAEGRDITQRKKAEEELALAEQNFRNSLDNSPLGIRISTDEGEVLYANQALLDIYGYGSVEQLRTPARERYTPESYVQHEERKALRKAGKPVPSSYEISIIRTDGEIRHLSVLRKEVIWNGETQYQVLYQDVTETRRMQQQLIVADRLASIGEMAAGIAHEINNPLTSIVGYSDLLKEEDIPAHIKEDIETINSEASRAAEIIKNMLIFARKHDVSNTSVDINQVLESVISLRLREHSKYNIKVNALLSPDIPTVFADALRLQQVFLNLVINAEYYLIEENGKGVLTIKSERDGDIVRVSVSDNGPGIKEEHIGHLFDPFFTTKDVGKGTGLGLSICHGIVTEYGGNIYVRSKEGKGATFFVELPVTQTSRKEDAV